ncbi:PREDICTED: breast cancer type 1 susceptibility protein isoform X1 [Sturnus vulgaris]|uniref:breast cancer type 1 susceptibility protein isoform X1 n=2 Tax=Sturnus vulgaris TaxID=9172 RepID=UPI000719F0CC|nr:PREDICTED: breast cancer type 1 susceptibility protein isoform X1 [Sturnus vulgaris]XP_014740965.1 PREDICTED: breast cancer type 1 susceptibility protein isoform X1 [Sturnus vulgaris]
MGRMDFSVITIQQVQNVLSAMQKNLECPICLDVVQEPVSTKCDHIFCRFCMFKLISKKKKGVVECPLCKTEVTKRSLKENSKFKQLIEGLLETIHAFELDTGVKFIKSHHFPQTSTEGTAAESLCKESSVIQSKGFRNRRKSAKGSEQENFTLQEASVNIQLSDAKMCHPRNKPQKSDSQKGTYIEFGSESSEEFFKQASKTGFEDKGAVQVSSRVRLEELESAEKGNENSCNAQPDKLCPKEITLPNVTGESDFSKECLSKKSTRSSAERAKPDQVNVTECQSSPLNVLAVDLLPEQCDRMGGASPTGNGDTSFFKSTEEMDEQQTQHHSENQGFDLEDSSENRLNKSKEMDTDVQSVEAVEAYEPENDSLHDKELPLQNLPQPETLHSATPNKVSKKRLKQSIQKVNEWFSKSNEILSSGSSLDESAASANVSGEGDLCLSDKESCISEKTDPMADSMEIAAVEGKKRRSEQTAESIKDKIFGRTYKRGRKSNPPSTLRAILPTGRKEDVAADKCLKNFSKDRLKRKRKSACALQPEDFIKKKDTEEADGGPQSVDRGLGDAGKKRCGKSVAVNESHLSQNRANDTLTEPEEGGESTGKKATEKVTTMHCDGEPEMYNCDQKSTKKRGSAAKRCRHSSRTMCSLELVVDRGSVFPDPAEPQIDSYPSSGEPRKADSEQNAVRRSRRLQILSEEMTKETKTEIKGARKNNSDRGRSVSGDQRNVAAHSAEYKDLCEPQDELSYRPVTNLEGGDLEANEMQVSLKNLPDTAETKKNQFNPSRLPSNCGSTVPDTSSLDSEILGSPLLLQPPSVSAGQTASQQTEKVSESPAAFPQECGHDSQNVPGDFKTEKLPMAKNVLELTKEAEDSDLDTQYLRNIFRHSKRSSFSLFQTPRQARAVEDPPSETLNLSCAAQVENKASKQLQPESLQEEKTAAQNLSRVSEKEKLKTCESAHIDPVPCFAVSTGEHRGDISQAAEEGTLIPARTGTAQAEHKNGLLQEEEDNEKPVSNEIGMESELRQNPIESDGSQSDQSNTEKHDSTQNDLNSVPEISFSSESNQAGKTGVADCKGPILHFQSTSMICPAACQQSPDEFSCEVIGTKSSKRERKHVEEDEEQAAQTVSTAMPQCSAAEALEEPLRENRDLTGLSETPDGLLCSDTDIEDTSLCETDRKEQSAVFVKSDNVLGKELHNRNASSGPGSRGIQKSRRRVQKLPSSDEESCEDEDLPCFQTFIFSKSVSTPFQTDKQMTSLVESPVVECPVSPSVLPHSVSNDDDLVQKVPEAALSNVCVSPSQESECSVNLFSSQSNMSEESPNGAQELKKHLSQVHDCKQMSSVNDSKETSQNCSVGLKTTKDECQEDPDLGANPGEASGSDSEISIVEDSCGPFSQGEILTTQQKNAMQNSLKKLQQEMAALEAVLKQNGSQNCEVLPVHRELPPSSTGGAFEKEQTRKEKNRSPELLFPSSKSSLTKRSDLEKGPECDSVLKNKTSSEKTKPVQEAVQEHRQCQLEAENAEEQQSGTRQNTASVSSDLFGNVTQSPDHSSSSLSSFIPQTAEATGGPVMAQNTDKSCGPGHKSKRSEPVPVVHNATGKQNATSPVVTKRKVMSIVASGLNHSEHLVVQKFVKKTQSTLSNHITEGTTHVIMKTDEELVCERTLKYFLGIAGGKWVVSYQWIIQSFKEGRILDEEPFEVRGDVINGRNHQGPKRARQALTEKIFKDFEICCCGPFTDMTTEHLEWMVELCGASVVKQPDLLSHTANSTAVVVVQPDAWKENVDYRAIQQQSSVAVVTREWVLDSVACYQCQELSAYLVS